MKSAKERARQYDREWDVGVEGTVKLAHLLEEHEADVRADERAEIAAVEASYTRAQFAVAVDEAHAALHEVEALGGPLGDGDMQKLHQRAHEALHRVGAGMPRVGCATHDPEAQMLHADLRKLGEQPLPCGHKVEDLIGGTDPDGRASVTKCGACLSARQPEIVAANRFRHEARRRADEIEAEIANHGCARTFHDALRFAKEGEEWMRLGAIEANRQRGRLDAAAWLIIAQRLLEREDGR